MYRLLPPVDSATGGGAEKRGGRRGLGNWEGCAGRLVSSIECVLGVCLKGWSEDKKEIDEEKGISCSANPKRHGEKTKESKLTVDSSLKSQGALGNKETMLHSVRHCTDSNVRRFFTCRKWFAAQIILLK